MFDFFARLFKSTPQTCTIEGYWCRTPIALDAKSAAAAGGKVSTVTAMVDVDFVVEGPNVQVRCVRLSRASPNVAAVKGKEIWHAKSICSNGDLDKAVAKDLEDRNGFLWLTMFRRWRSTFGKSTNKKLATA